jgi:hypothetical protein
VIFFFTPTKPFTSAFSYVHMVQQTGELAAALGNASEATRLGAMAASLLADFNRAFISAAPGAPATCAVAAEDNVATVACAGAASDTIASVSFAGYGELAAQCPSPSDDSACSADLAAGAAAACVGQHSCTALCSSASGAAPAHAHVCTFKSGDGKVVNVTHVADPCWGVTKTHARAVACAPAPAPAPAPTPTPTPAGAYDNGVMTAYALAIALGAADAAGGAMNATALDALSGLMVRNRNHHTTGIIGYKFLHESLRAGGHEDQALANLENTDYPSIGYFFANEYEPATSNLWELTDGFHEGNGMNSRNHHMFSSYSKYVVQRLGGLAHDGASKAAHMVSVLLYHVYRYILRESCSQFDSLPLTSLRRRRRRPRRRSASPPRTYRWRSRTATLRCAGAATAARSASRWRRSGTFSFIYRYILRESCSQFDSLPLTSLTISPGRSAALDCGARGGTITRVTFASFGTPRGVCGAWARDARCDSPRSAAALAALCVGKASCEIARADAATFGHPGAGCSARGGEAWLSAEVQCSGPVELHARVVLPVGSKGTVVFPTGLYSSLHGKVTLSEGGVALSIAREGAAPAAAPLAVDGVRSVRFGVDHAGRDVVFADVGSGEYDFAVTV